MALRTETLDRSRGGMWPWLGQRVTAVLVIVTIMVHLVLTHYVAIGQLSFDNIGDRLAGGAVLVNDIVLLVAVVYHALAGPARHRGARHRHHHGAPRAHALHRHRPAVLRQHRRPPGRRRGARQRPRAC